MTKIEVAAVTLIFYNIILCILCQCLGACPLDELLTCQTKSKPISLLFFVVVPNSLHTSLSRNSDSSANLAASHQQQVPPAGYKDTRAQCGKANGKSCRHLRLRPSKS